MRRPACVWLKATYCMYIKFRGVQIFVVFMAYLFPTKINPPQLIFLPILPHRCIQSVIKFSVNIDHNIKIDVRMYRRFFWEITRPVTKIYCLLPVTSYCSYDLATQKEIGRLHKCFLAHA